MKGRVIAPNLKVMVAEGKIDMDQANHYQLLANRTARKHGYGTATFVVIGSQDRILATTSYGYRKQTTGEYVPKKYLQNFGWKNTYYQHAECDVEVKFCKEM